MREIKFRMFNKVAGVMHDWSEIGKVLHARYFDEWIESGEIELMQYTGLHDKNGKEIYEGDVVVGPGVKSWLPGSYQSETNSLVSWEGAAWWPFADADDNAPYPRPEDCEVIGNIYENPELLK